jgi:hypothetical protein
MVPFPEELYSVLPHLKKLLLLKNQTIFTEKN